MRISIGEKIKQRAKELRIGPTELGELINTSKQNVYGIYIRKSIDVDTLRKLSIALNYDFFQYYRYSEKLYTIVEPSNILEQNSKKYVSLIEHEKLKTELENLKEKYELLIKVNKLLEKSK